MKGGLALVLAANILASFTAGLVIPVMPLFLLARGLSLFQLAGVFAMVALSAVGVQLVAGRHARVFGRRGVVLALLFLSIVTFPLYLFARTPLEFLVVYAVSSSASAAASPGLQVLIAESSAPEERARAFANLGSAASFSYAGALVVGAFLIPLGYSVVFYVASVVSLVSFSITAGFMIHGRMARAARVSAGRLPAPWRDAIASARRERARADALAALVRRRGAQMDARRPMPPEDARSIRWASLHLFVFGAALSLFPVFFPIYLRQRGLPVQWVGAVIAASWITYGLFQPVGARIAERTGRYRTLVVASLLVAAALNLVIALGSLPWIVVSWTLLGVADGMSRPVTASLIANGVTPAARGSAFGWTSAADTAARIAGPILLATVISSRGVQAGFLVVTVVFALSAVPILFLGSPASRAPEPRPSPVIPGEPA